MRTTSIRISGDREGIVMWRALSMIMTIAQYYDYGATLRIVHLKYTTVKVS